MTIDAIRLGLGLLLLIAVNIVLGSIDAVLSGQFDRPKFRRGIAKGLIVALCFIVTYAVGWLNPDIMAVSINGQSVNLLTAVYIVIMAGFLFYAKEVLVKLVTFVKGRLEVGELTVGLTSEKIADSGHQEPKPPDEVSPPQPDNKPVGKIGF